MCETGLMNFKYDFVVPDYKSFGNSLKPEEKTLKMKTIKCVFIETVAIHFTKMINISMKQILDCEVTERNMFYYLDNFIISITLSIY